MKISKFDQDFGRDIHITPLVVTVNTLTTI